MTALKNGIVVKVSDWKIPVVSHRHYLAQPTVSMDVRFHSRDISGLSATEFKAFDSAFEKHFKSPFERCGDSCFVQAQKIVDAAEKEVEDFIDAHPTKVMDNGMKAFKPVLDKATARLEEQYKHWKLQIAKLVSDAYEKGRDAAMKAGAHKFSTDRIKPEIDLSPTAPLEFLGGASLALDDQHPLYGLARGIRSEIKGLCRGLEASYASAKHRSGPMLAMARAAKNECLRLGEMAHHAKHDQSAPVDPELAKAVKTFCDQLVEVQVQLESYRRGIEIDGELVTGLASLLPEANEPPVWREVRASLDYFRNVSSLHECSRLTKELDGGCDALRIAVASGDTTAVERILVHSGNLLDAMKRRVEQDGDFEGEFCRISGKLMGAVGRALQPTPG